MSRVASNISFLYFLENNYAEAERYVDIALNSDRYNARALVNKGNCLFMKNDFRKAKELYLEAIGVEADCIEALYNLGFVNKKLNLFIEALQVLFLLFRLWRKSRPSSRFPKRSSRSRTSMKSSAARNRPLSGTRSSWRNCPTMRECSPAWETSSSEKMTNSRLCIITSNLTGFFPWISIPTFGWEFIMSSSASMKRRVSTSKEPRRSSPARSSGNLWLLLAREESEISRKHSKFIRLSTRNTPITSSACVSLCFCARIWD